MPTIVITQPDSRVHLWSERLDTYGPGTPRAPHIPRAPVGRVRLRTNRR